MTYDTTGRRIVTTVTKPNDQNENVSVDDLEDRHRRHQILSDGTSVTATLSATGIKDDNTIYTVLTIDGEPFIIAFEPTPEDAAALVALHEQRDIPFDGDLSNLVGETFKIRFDDYPDRVTFVDIDYTLSVSDNNSLNQSFVASLQSTLSESHRQAIYRAGYHDDAKHQPLEATVDSIDVLQNGDTLQVQIKIHGTSLYWHVPIPDNLGSSGNKTYHQLVEQLGKGSPSGIPGGRLFLLQTDTVGPNISRRGALAVVEDGISRWQIFTSAYDARAAATRTAPSDPTQFRTTDAQRGWLIAKASIYALLFISLISVITESILPTFSAAAISVMLIFFAGVGLFTGVILVLLND